MYKYNISTTSLAYRIIRKKLNQQFKKFKHGGRKR